MQLLFSPIIYCSYIGVDISLYCLAVTNSNLTGKYFENIYYSAIFVVIATNNAQENNCRWKNITSKSIFGIKKNGNSYQILVIFHLYDLSREKGEIMLKRPIKVRAFLEKEAVSILP